MISIVFLFIFINIKFYCCDISKLKYLLLQNSSINNNSNICTIKENTKIKKKKKNILLEPLKKKVKIKKKTRKNKSIEEDIKSKSDNSWKEIINKKETKTNIFQLFPKKKKRSKTRKAKPKRKNYSKKKTITIKIDNRKKNNIHIKESDSRNINNLPFNLAKSKDKRNLFQIFCSIISQKIYLINLFYGEEKIKSILFSQFVLSLLVHFFFNALLYSDEIISRKYHNNGKLELIVTIILSLLSNIFSSIIIYYFNYSELIEERLEQVIEMKKALYYQNILNNFLKQLKLKVFLLILKEISIIFFGFYYVIIFFIVYNYSTNSLIFNYLASLLEDLIKSLIITFIISVLRKASLDSLNRYIYNTSKYINEKL